MVTAEELRQVVPHWRILKSCDNEFGSFNKILIF